MSAKKAASGARAEGGSARGKTGAAPSTGDSVSEVVRNLAIEYREPSSLAAYDRNARVHSGEQLRQIGRAMREFGWTNPLLIDEAGGLVAGHGRLEAARMLWDKGVEIEGAGGRLVPCIVIPGLTAERRAALALLDNRIALNAGWNETLLAGELRLLQEGGWELTDLGFNVDEIADLLVQPQEGFTDPNAAPPAPAEDKTVARPGDVWLLGPHRVVCGDSTVPQVAQAAMRGLRPKRMVTDPPYGVEYDPGWRNDAPRADGTPIGARATGVVMNDDRADWREAWRLFPGPVAYVWHGGLRTAAVAASLEACGLMIKAQIVWVKTRMAISRGAYHWQHEPCLYAVAEGEDDGWRFQSDHEVAAYAVREGRPAAWRGGRKQSTVWMMEHIKSETGHGTQKPVEAMRRPIENNSAPGEVVYDPFLGSGTTVIAATGCGRICVGCELSPAYVDVIVRRWEEFTHQSAVLDGDGRTFAAMAKERVKATNGEQGSAGAAPDGASREGRRTATGAEAQGEKEQPAAGTARGGARGARRQSG